MAGSGQISEHKHQSKAKGQHPMTQIATRSLFENQDVRVWEMDVAPGDTFGLHHHTNDYVLYITSGANLKVDDKDAGPTTSSPMTARSSTSRRAGPRVSATSARRLFARR